jgi:hypothetical protein
MQQGAPKGQGLPAGAAALHDAARAGGARGGGAPPRPRHQSRSVGPALLCTTSPQTAALTSTRTRTRRAATAPLGAGRSLEKPPGAAVQAGLLFFVGHPSATLPKECDSGAAAEATEPVSEPAAK